MKGIFISIIICFSTKLYAQDITGTPTPIDSSENISLRIKPILDFSTFIESIDGDEIVSSGAGENEINVNDILSLNVDSTSILFGANIDDLKERIEIIPNNTLSPNTTYTITLDSIRSQSDETKILGITTYTFTTGSATSINTLSLNDELCIEGEATLSQIVLREGAKGNFFNPGNNDEGAMQNIVLEIPVGYEFDITDANITVNNGETSDIELTTSGDNESLQILSDDKNKLVIGFERSKVSGATVEDTIRVNGV